jgi:hypothetical protein
VIVMVGSRAPHTIVYPVSELAQKHGAGVQTETEVPKDAYSPFEAPWVGPMPDGALPE